MSIAKELKRRTGRYPSTEIHELCRIIDERFAAIESRPLTMRNIDHITKYDPKDPE